MNKTHSPNLPRILHFVPGFRMGGIESLLMSLYRGLDKTEMQFDFMVDTVDDLPEFKEIRAAGGRVFQMGRYLDNPIKYQIQVEKIFGKYSSEYIALHSHSVIRALPVLLSASRHGIAKRIIHSHTDSLAGSKQALIAPPITKITNLFATDFWACSDAAGDFFFKGKPYQVFNNTISTSNFLYSSDKRKQIRNLLGFKDHHLVIGHTGRFTYQKNHEYLIKIFYEAYKLEPNLRLLLVGDGPLMPKIEETASDLGISHATKLVGSQSDIPAYLSAMDLFFLPSHYEGFCISLLEAQANGLPCLAADTIPKEVQITPNVITFSLEMKSSDVVYQLLNMIKKGRTDSRSNIKDITNKGYDTDTQLVNLIKYYQ